MGYGPPNPPYYVASAFVTSFSIDENVIRRKENCLSFDFLFSAKSLATALYLRKYGKRYNLTQNAKEEISSILQVVCFFQPQSIGYNPRTVGDWSIYELIGLKFGDQNSGSYW